MSRLSSGNTTASRRQTFLDIVRQSNASCESGDYQTAVALYCEALKIDPDNHILYSNRSAAYIKLGQFARALQDALKARDLNPKWSKVCEHTHTFYQIINNKSVLLPMSEFKSKMQILW